MGFYLLSRFLILTAYVGLKQVGVLFKIFQRLPTGLNLFRRGVITDSSDISYILCHNTKETELHLFAHCEFSIFIWYVTFRWLGPILVMPSDLSILTKMLFILYPTKQLKKIVILI